jgi:hypothetical protein
MGLRENGGGRDLVASTAILHLQSRSRWTPAVTGRPCNHLELRGNFSGNSEMTFFRV